MASGLLIVPNYMPALDINGRPLPGALMYFYVNDTTTPTTVYSDAALTTPHTNPLEADASGVFDLIYMDADTLITVSVTDRNGVVQATYTDQPASTGDVSSGSRRWLRSFHPTDDDAAMELASEWMRAGTYSIGGSDIPQNNRRLYIEPRLVTLTQSVNLQGIAAMGGWGIDAMGATLLLQMEGKTGLDLLGSRWGHFSGINIVGDRSSKPAIGIQVGRLYGAGASADGHVWERCTSSGTFSRCAFYNLSSETGGYHDLAMYNAMMDGEGERVMIFDGYNQWGAITDFDEPEIDPDTYMSNIQHCMINADLRSYTKVKPALEMINADQFEAYCSYGVSLGNLIRVVGSSDGLRLGFHAEPGGEIDSNIEVDAITPGEVQLRNFWYREHYNATATSPIVKGADATLVRIINADIGLVNSVASTATHLFSSGFIASGQIYAGNLSLGNMTNFNGIEDVSDKGIGSATIPTGSSILIGQSTDVTLKGEYTIAGTTASITGTNLLAGANINFLDGIDYHRSPSAIKQSFTAHVKSATGHTIAGSSYLDFTSTAYLTTIGALFFAYTANGTYVPAALSADPGTPVEGAQWTDGNTKKHRTLLNATLRDMVTSP